MYLVNPRMLLSVPMFHDILFLQLLRHCHLCFYGSSCSGHYWNQPPHLLLHCAVCLKFSCPLPLTTIRFFLFVCLCLHFECFLCSLLYFLLLKKKKMGGIVWFDLSFRWKKGAFRLTLTPSLLWYFLNCSIKQHLHSPLHLKCHKTWQPVSCPLLHGLHWQILACLHIQPNHEKISIRNLDSSRKAWFH